ncbi:hypothetical protein AA0616_0712 [Komagataeibacter nataicola NRIC 0616]|nr:hypothetical protein AA0616_0712 [Komagataeibacter nataicola NRIC 0616]
MVLPQGGMRAKQPVTHPHDPCLADIIQTSRPGTCRHASRQEAQHKQEGRPHAGSV